MQRLVLGLLMVWWLAAGPAFAACEGYTPGQKPQNTGRDVVGQDYDTIVDRGFMTFGVYEDFAPYSFVKDGVLTGIDIEVGGIIADFIGVEARYQAVTAGETVDDDLRNHVWNGNIIDGSVVNVLMHVPYNVDFACRNEQAVLTGQYFNEKIALAYRTDVYPDNPPVPAYFRYDRVGVETDTIADFYLAGMANGQAVKNIVHYTSHELAMQALAAGEIPAVMGARGQLEHGLVDGVKMSNPPLPGLRVGEWTLGVAVRHTYRQLGYAVDDAIRAAVNDGRMSAIFTKYGLTFAEPVW